jgi:hypothetical protein
MAMTFILYRIGMILASLQHLSDGASEVAPLLGGLLENCRVQLGRCGFGQPLCWVGFSV